jgi:hypothetical protein
VLAGQPPAALADLLHASKPLPQAGDDLALSVPAETLRQRADVRAAEQQVAAAAACGDQAEASRLPSFSIAGSLGLSALTPGTLTNGASVISSILGSVTLPLFDGGGLRPQVSVQQAALDQARQRWRAAILAALTDVEDAIVALQGNRVRLTRLGNAAEAATNTAALARLTFNFRDQRARRHGRSRRCRAGADAHPAATRHGQPKGEFLDGVLRRSLNNDRQRKRPKRLTWAFCTSMYFRGSFSGGAGGNRTPVRKTSPGRSTRLAD